MGGMLGGSLGRRPVVGVDRTYEWVDGQRHTYVDIPSTLRFNRGFKKVLLVTGEVRSGNTILKAIDFLKDQFPGSEVQSASMYVRENSDFFPNY